MTSTNLFALPFMTGAARGSAPSSPSKLQLPSNQASFETGRHANLSSRVPAHWKLSGSSQPVSEVAAAPSLTFASMPLEKEVTNDQTPGILSTLRGDGSLSQPAAPPVASKPFKLNPKAAVWTPKA